MLDILAGSRAFCESLERTKIVQDGLGETRILSILAVNPRNVKDVRGYSRNTWDFLLLSRRLWNPSEIS